MLYVNERDGEFAVDLRSEAGSGRRVCQLLWGDPVHETGVTHDGFVQVAARGRVGWIPRSRITRDGLLEVYVIDVGQGDGVLIRTPDDRWHLIDAGVENARQMTGKGAANFIRWKFRKDLERTVELETVILSHPDYDHYGGLINLLSGDLDDGEPPLEVSVRSFYHTGMGRFLGDDPLGRMEAGEVAPFPVRGHRMRRRDRFITELLDGRESFSSRLDDFQGRFAALAELVASVPENVARIGMEGAVPGFLPGYGPTHGVTGPGGTPLTVRVLGPAVERFGNGNGAPRAGLRKLASESVTRNGHSVTLRFDYGDARLLMTGDLNEESQRLLLSYVDPQEYRADVVKGCHHGSEDVYMRFLEAMAGRATVISSGDNEDYAHPRPVILGASGFYGRSIECIERNRVRTLPPLLYSTELARSVRLKGVEKVAVDHDDDVGTRPRPYPARRVKVKPEGARYRDLEHTPLATDLVYGLVNVRTDGRRILCATMEETGTEFDIKVFEAG